jgi:hypothetical protein
LAGAKHAGNTEHRGGGKLVHVKSPKRKTTNPDGAG